jgi:hypothetical protein
MRDDMLALYLLLGQTAERAVWQQPSVSSAEPLLLGPGYDAAPAVPETARRASRAATAYRLFFVFETYLRELVVDVLGKAAEAAGKTWWDLVPGDLQTQVAKLEETEDTKAWMALGSRDKSALMTYPQLLAVIDQTWSSGFDELVRDKSLVNEARLVSHLRNTVAHMTDIPEEEINRVRQVMRDWFRVIAP